MMTPGFAKSRAELPWLPYPETDRVIINSHNFTPAVFDPSVNGKSPVFALCPSRDSVGNGTTTLYDLQSTNDATLTNMSAAAWVSDTASGGVRALEFDGVDDCVLMPNYAALSAMAASFTYSMWIKLDTLPVTNKGIIDTDPNGIGAIQCLWIASKIRFSHGGDAGVEYAPGVGFAGAWHHLMATMTVGKLWTGYVDGVSVGTYTSTRTTAINGVNIGRFNLANNIAMRFDDLRMWSQALDASDNAVLYAAGAGRGISA